MPRAIADRQKRGIGRGLPGRRFGRLDRRGGDLRNGIARVDQLQNGSPPAAFVKLSD
jgi:hypothetical protein